MTKQRIWPPFFWVCFSMCVGVMGTALASPLYPLYQAHWGLMPSHITLIFVAYMMGALLSLLFLGRLSDRFGFLPVLRCGLIFVTLGVFLSALAWNVPTFIVSRVLIGVASGMITTSASVGMSQLNRSGDAQRASAMTSFAMALGFGSGPMVGGLIAQWTPVPLVSAYVPSVLLGLLAVYALYQVKIEPAPHAAAHAAASGPASWRQWLPRLTLPPHALRRPFLIGCMMAFTAFAIFSLYASLAPSFMAHMVPWSGPAVSGLSIGVILFLSAGFQYLSRRMANKTAAVAGLVGLAVCNVLLILTSLANSPVLFALCVLATGLGHGLTCMAGIGIVNKVSSPLSRSGLLSTYLVIGYLGTILPILGVGWLSDHVGLTAAIVVFCTAMSTLAGTLAWLAKTTPAIQPQH